MFTSITFTKQNNNKTFKNMKTTVLVSKNEQSYFGKPIVSIQVFKTKRQAKVFVDTLQKEDFAKDYIITVY